MMTFYLLSWCNSFTHQASLLIRGSTNGITLVYIFLLRDLLRLISLTQSHILQIHRVLIHELHWWQPGDSTTRFHIISFEDLTNLIVSL